MCLCPQVGMGFVLCPKWVLWQQGYFKNCRGRSWKRFSSFGLRAHSSCLVLYGVISCMCFTRLADYIPLGRNHGFKGMWYKSAAQPRAALVLVTTSSGSLMYESTCSISCRQQRAHAVLVRALLSSRSLPPHQQAADTAYSGNTTVGWLGLTALTHYASSVLTAKVIIPCVAHMIRWPAFCSL